MAPSEMDIDSMLNEVIDTSQFDPAWFDLEPDSFYGKNNNSCGFIPDLPNIVDEVDKSIPRPTGDFMVQDYDSTPLLEIYDASVGATERERADYDEPTLRALEGLPAIESGGAATRAK